MIQVLSVYKRNGLALILADTRAGHLSNRQLVDGPLSAI